MAFPLIVVGIFQALSKANINAVCTKGCAILDLSILARFVGSVMKH